MSYNPYSVMYDIGAKKIDTVLIDDYQLYLNFGNFLFPAIVQGHGKGSQLFAEVWETSKAVIPYIDKYERVDSGLYTRDEITVGKYHGFIYRMNKVTEGMVPIQSNNWIKFHRSISDALMRKYEHAFSTVDSFGVILEDKKVQGETRKKYTNLYNEALEKYWSVCDEIEKFCQ